MNADETLRQLIRIHDEIDRDTRKLERVHAGRLQCRRGCSGCCADGLTVYEVEAARIRRHAATLLASCIPHPEGACAFLDADGACRIYEHRPYVCRTQGLPLRWFDETDDGETVELRDICELNEEGEPVVGLSPEVCWEIGPYEARLAALQRQADGGAGRRVALRGLFGKVPADL